MPVGLGDVPEAVRRELYKLWPVSASKVVDAQFNRVFQVLVDGRHKITLAAMQAPARFKQFGSGEVLPNRDPFQGGKVDVTPVMLGESRSFQFQTVEEVMAAIGTDLQLACDNWAAAEQNTRDLQCTDYLKDAVTTGYDSKVLFATDHPQLSRYPTASSTTYNNNGTGANVVLTHAAVRDLVTLAEDTNAYTESGDKMDNKTTSMVVTSQGQFLELLPILGSQQRSGTANNDVNALNQLGITPMLWRNLAGAAGGQEYLYAFSTQAGQGGLYYDNKQSVIIETQRNFKTKDIEASAHLQGIPTHTDWRKAHRQQLAAVS